MKRMRVLLLLVLIGILSILSWSVVQVQAAESAACTTINQNFGQNLITQDPEKYGAFNRLGEYQFKAGESLTLYWEIELKDKVEKSTGTILIGTKTSPFLNSSQDSADGVNKGSTILEITKAVETRKHGTYIKISIKNPADPKKTIC